MTVPVTRLHHACNGMRTSLGLGGELESKLFSSVCELPIAVSVFVVVLHSYAERAAPMHACSYALCFVNRLGNARLARVCAGDCQQ